jgi:hypothetical protein
MKEKLAKILNLDPNISDEDLIAVVQRHADIAKKAESDEAKRDVAHEKEIQKILTQACGALRRDQAEQILRDRKAQS